LVSAPPSAFGGREKKSRNFGAIQATQGRTSTPPSYFAYYYRLNRGGTTEIEEKRDEQHGAGVDRRTFIGALGAAAVAGALGPAAEGQSPPPTVYNYLDSFGNIVPCASDTIAAGVFPPPIPTNAVNPGALAKPRRHWLFGSHSHKAKQPAKLAPRDSASCTYTQPTCGTTAPSPGYPAFNILMIIVDQMRAPRWLPSLGTNPPAGRLQGQPAIDALLPNIAAIRNQSFVFANYDVAATSCSPARATLLTGLYSQQTCMFVSQDPPNPLKSGTVAGLSAPVAALEGRARVRDHRRCPVPDGQRHDGRAGVEL
jgi:hypothetical protein